MSKAGPICSKITRRAAIAAGLSAALPPLACTLPAHASAPTLIPDPILATIAAHRAAVAALDAAAQHLSDVDEGLIDDGGMDRGSGADDDPLLLAASAAFHAACDAESRAAWALARARPASPAAAAALLRYAGDLEADGGDWPEAPDEDDGGDWVAAFHHSLAAALDGWTVPP
jgi:hypothetical protein